MLKNSLPELYQGLLPDAFLQQNQEETLATCHSCYKSKKTSPAPHYDPQLKCCTFYPFIPNYLVGAWLTEQKGSPLALQTLKALIRDRGYALPIGLCPPPAYQLKFQNKAQDEFGNNSDLLCPFYQMKTGECGAWAYRGHECATFFCVSSDGKKGEEFWQNTRDYLHKTEMDLSQMAMVEKGYTPKEIEMNLSLIKIDKENFQNVKWKCEATEWNQLWAHHQDDIEGYYKATYEYVLNNKNKLI